MSHHTPKLTDQQIFDRTARHLLKQGKKSRDTEHCLYRGPNGLRCPVGALISNRCYRPGMEGVGASSLFNCFEANMNACGLYASHKGILEVIQDVHDSQNARSWRRYLGQVGNELNLSTHVLNAPRPR